jgi:hypothetical protein
MVRLRRVLPAVSRGALIDVALLTEGARGLARLSCHIADV